MEKEKAMMTESQVTVEIKEKKKKTTPLIKIVYDRDERLDASYDKMSSLAKAVRNALSGKLEKVFMASVPMVIDDGRLKAFCERIDITRGGGEIEEAKSMAHGVTAVMCSGEHWQNADEVLGKTENGDHFMNVTPEDLTVYLGDIAMRQRPQGPRYKEWLAENPRPAWPESSYVYADREGEWGEADDVSIRFMKDSYPDFYEAYKDWCEKRKAAGFATWIQRTL